MPCSGGVRSRTGTPLPRIARARGRCSSRLGQERELERGRVRDVAADDRGAARRGSGDAGRVVVLELGELLEHDLIVFCARARSVSHVSEQPPLGTVIVRRRVVDEPAPLASQVSAV